MSDRQLLYLDVDDEITSAVARIRGARARRIGLVLPHGSRLATSRINFRLLAREADARGRVLEIVTPDAAARALAAAAGLPAFASVAAFESGQTAAATPLVVRHAPGDDSPTVVTPAASAPAPRAVGPRAGRGRRRLGLVLGVAAVVLGATGFGAANLLPSAEIVLAPATMTLGPLELTVTAQEGITQPDPTNLLIPANRIDFEVAADGVFPATGIRVEETAATGEVTFSSLNTGASNTIAAGAVVRTESGTEFRTLAEVVLPPAEIGIVDKKFVVIPSTRRVGVEALVVGEGGNVAAGTIVIVPEEENPLRTTVTNEAPTTGGTRTEFPVVAQADVDTALAALDADLIEAARAELAGGLAAPKRTRLFEETLEVGETVPTTDPTLLVGTEVAEFALAATADASAVGVDTDLVATLADARIRDGVAAGWRLVEDSVDIEVGDALVTGRTITFPATATAAAVREVDRAALLERIRGLEAHEARTILGAFGAVDLTLWPEWATRIPTIDARIDLRVEPAP